MKKLLQKLNCFLGNHKWTSKAEQGIKPQKAEKFWEYAIMYCENCEKISNLSKKFL